MSKVKDKKTPEEQLGEIAVTKEEEEELAKFLSEFPKQRGYPVPEEKHGVFHFLTEALRTTDSSKVGNIDKEEVAVIRNLKEGSIFFSMLGSSYVASWLQAWSEMILATSDSKGGFMIEAAITQKKDVKLGAKKEKKRSRWLQQKEGGASESD